eukprot:11163424-Ditylum_brightwellii.AAC.1
MGSCGASKEVGNQVEQQGKEYPQLDENNDTNSKLIEESSVSQQGISSQPIDLSDGDEAFTSPPLHRSTRDK